MGAHKQERIKVKKRPTRRDLAKKYGFSEQFLGQILNGKKKCPSKHVPIISKIIKQL